MATRILSGFLIRSAFLLFTVSLVSSAEYLSTFDGSRLFFVSPDRLVGTNQSFRTKLFPWDAEHGVQLVYESPYGWVCCISVTGDGSLVALHVGTPETLERNGVLLNVRTGEVEIVGSSEGLSAIISRNGRYLFTGEALVDRNVGTSRPLSHGVNFVGDDGSLLYRRNDRLHRVDPDGTDRMLMTSLRDGRLIDAIADTTKAIVESGPGVPLVVDTITGQEVDLRAVGASLSFVLLSSDGEWVTFMAEQPPDYERELVLCRSDATGCRALGDPPIASYPIAISGDGGTVFTGVDEFVVRVDAGSGRVEKAFGVPYLALLGREPYVPGSLVRFNAANAGEHFTVNGRESPLWSPPGTLPVIQIPWDLEDSWVQFTMHGGDTPFEMITPTYGVSDFFPQGFVPGSPGLNEGQPAYREDWSATTFECPANPGEIVHIFTVGLGQVDCPVETGQPAPVDRLCRITRTVDWTWNTTPGVSEPADVLFAGLAPGTVGLYQIDVRAPHCTGCEFAQLSDGFRNPFVAFIHMWPGSRQVSGSDCPPRPSRGPGSVNRPRTPGSR